MTTAKNETDIIAYAKARDDLLDQWLAYCSPMELQLTARWLLDGSNAEHMPRSLVRVQERLMEELNAAPAPATEE